MTNSLEIAIRTLAADFGTCKLPFGASIHDFWLFELDNENPRFTVALWANVEDHFTGLFVRKNVPS